MRACGAEGCAQSMRVRGSMAKLPCHACVVVPRDAHAAMAVRFVALFFLGPIWGVSQSTALFGTMAFIVGAGFGWAGAAPHMLMLSVLDVRVPPPTNLPTGDARSWPSLPRAAAYATDPTWP